MNEKSILLDEAHKTLWELYKQVKARTEKVDALLKEVTDLQDDIKIVIWQAFNTAERKAEAENVN